MSELNGIVRDDENYKKDLGDSENSKVICDLMEFYSAYGTPINYPENFSFRLAPSIIVRSECEMLGLARPRFAYRASADGFGIMNLRRFKSQSEALEKEKWVEWDSDKKNANEGGLIEKKLSSEEAKAQLGSIHEYEQSSSFDDDKPIFIADSLLIPPPYIEKDYHIITTKKLWEAYGETGFKGKNAFPYVMYTKLGGGLCAQACCFMATALLHEHCHGIYGISEITAIAPSKYTTDDDNYKYFHGLDIDGMRKFFLDSHVRLGAFKESHLPRWVDGGSDITFTKKLYSLAFRSYVSSGVPVLLPVDITKLHKDNPSVDPKDLLQRGAEDKDHVVVINGVHKKEPDSFLIADPADQPFHKIDMAKLWDSRLTTRNKDSLYLPYLPVVPREIQLPFFFDYNISETHSLVDNLCHYNKSLEDRLNNCEFRLFKWDKLRGIITLEGADTSILDNNNTGQRLQQYATKNNLNEQWYWIEFVRESDDPVNPRFRTVRIYNAEFDSERFHNSDRTVKPPYHVAQINDLFKYKPLDLESPIPNQNQDTVFQKNLKLGLLSSFDMMAKDGKLPFFRQPEINAPCELYAFVLPFMKFLREDFITWSKKVGREIVEPPHVVSAFEFLSQYNKDYINSITRSIQSKTQNVKIVSFASFFPGLSFAKDTPHAKKTREAIRCLGELTHNLRAGSTVDGTSDDQQKKLNTIELVAGSRVQGLSVAKKIIIDDENSDEINNETDEANDGNGEKINNEIITAKEFNSEDIDINDTEHVAEEESTKDKKDNWIIAARIIPRDEAIKNIVDNLDLVLQALNHIYEGGNPITFALEIEPGPLFAINDFKSILHLCKALDERQVDNPLFRHVGINLDIAHCSIVAHSDPRRVNNEAIQNFPKRIIKKIKKINEKSVYFCIFRRICHAHISGYHQAAHFGDISLKEEDNSSIPPVKNIPPIMNVFDATFTQWIELLEYRMEMGTQEKDWPKYSGHVMIELEATSDISHVNETFAALRNRECFAE